VKIPHTNLLLHPGLRVGLLYGAPDGAWLVVLPGGVVAGGNAEFSTQREMNYEGRGTKDEVKNQICVVDQAVAARASTRARKYSSGSPDQSMR
jgi:hypothetical protein